MLGVVGSNLKMVKFFMQNLWISADIVVVWPGSCKNFGPGHAHLFDFQLATCHNTLPQGGQTHATCLAQQCCELLSSNVAIVWPGLANAGPIMLRSVALRCCYRLTGASNLSQQHPTCHNMSQHIATGWPNARNVLHPTMLRYVALKRCNRLAGA